MERDPRESNKERDSEDRNWERDLRKRNAFSYRESGSSLLTDYASLGEMEDYDIENLREDESGASTIKERCLDDGIFLQGRIQDEIWMNNKLVDFSRRTLQL